MEDISYLLERFSSSQNSDLIHYFDVDEIVELINYFLDIENVEKLKCVIEMGNKLHPDDIVFKMALCRTHAAMEDYDSALKVIEENNIIGDKDIDLVRIECYCELNRYNEAIEVIDNLTANDSPYLEDAIVHMACVLNDSEMYQEKAFGFIQHALTMFPDNFVLKLELCFNHESHGNTKEALEICRELIDEDPYVAELWETQGRLFSVCADFEKAVESFDFALTCTENNRELEYEIKLMKAYCLYKNESYNQAIHCYKELFSYDEFVSTEVNPYLAECYMSTDDYEKAYHVLKNVIGHKDFDDEVSVYGNFIYCCIETERKNEAVNVFADALKLFPNSILEYMSSLSIIKNQQNETLSDKESIVFPSELARMYLSNSAHNN